MVRRNQDVNLCDRQVTLSLRGTEYDFLLSRLGRRKIDGSRVALQGVGAGDETTMWNSFDPEMLVGIDYEPEPHAQVPMLGGDLLQLPLGDSTFDIAASLNVFEHVQDVDRAVSETVRILKPGGWVVASFGPLYTSYGGDHFSSLRGGLKHGYNHLLLDEDDYRDFVGAMTIEGIDIVDGNPRYGLAYIRADLFSHASFEDYRAIFTRYLDVRHLRGYVEPHCLRFREQFPQEWNRLLAKGHLEKDLLISAVTLIGRKSRQPKDSM